MIDRLKGANVLMNCVLKYCKVDASGEKEKGKEEKKKKGEDDDGVKNSNKNGSNEAQSDFLSKVLYTIAVCLRFPRTFLPFLKDKNQFLSKILAFMNSYKNNRELTINGLTILKLLLSSE